MYVLILNESDNSDETKRQRGGCGSRSRGHTCPFSAALTSAGISLSSAFLPWLFSCQAGEGRGPCGSLPIFLTDRGKTRGSFSLQHKDALKASVSPARNLARAAGPTQWIFSSPVCLRNHQLTSSSPGATAEIPASLAVPPHKS